MGAKRQSLSVKLQAAFDGLLCRLSPENLCCDGEASAAEVEASRRRIAGEWSVLESRAGRRVSEEEVYRNCRRG